MKAETVATAATSAAGAAAAAGVTWLAVAFALVGAAAGLHFDKEGRPSGYGMMLLAIGAVTAFALILAALVHALLSDAPPLFGYLSMARVPVEVWAGTLGLFGKPLYRRLRHETKARNAPPGG